MTSLAAVCYILPLPRPLQRQREREKILWTSLSLSLALYAPKQALYSLDAITLANDCTLREQRHREREREKVSIYSAHSWACTKCT